MNVANKYFAARRASQVSIERYVDLQTQRSRLILSALAEYGNGDGEHLPGDVRSHFPDDVKRDLNIRGDQINRVLSEGLLHWMKSGRSKKAYIETLENFAAHIDQQINDNSIIP